MAGRTWVTGPDVELTLHGDDPKRSSEILNGVIDTGASISCVDNRIAKKLGLIATDRKPVQMADGRIIVSSIYGARMVINALGFDDMVQVCGVEMALPSRRLLIGRSFLRNYILNYHGQREQFEFHEIENGDAFFHFDHDE